VGIRAGTGSGLPHQRGLPCRRAAGRNHRTIVCRQDTTFPVYGEITDLTSRFLPVGVRSAAPCPASGTDPPVSRGEAARSPSPAGHCHPGAVHL